MVYSGKINVPRFYRLPQRNSHNDGGKQMRKDPRILWDLPEDTILSSPQAMIKCTHLQILFANIFWTSNLWEGEPPSTDSSDQGRRPRGTRGTRPRPPKIDMHGTQMALSSHKL